MHNRATIYTKLTAAKSKRPLNDEPVKTPTTIQRHFLQLKIT